jgi:soluble lytic murein transglycosylase
MNDDASATVDYSGLLTEKTHAPLLSKRSLAIGLGICAAALVIAASVHVPGALRHRRLVEKYASAEGLEPELILAMISVESKGRKKAVSPKGAVGLMQIMPDTAKEVALKNGMPAPSKTDLFNPDTNIRLGVSYFASLLKRYNNDLTLALAAYNAGPGTVHEWRSKHPDLSSGELRAKAFFSETKAYVTTVLAKRDAMKKKETAR